MSETLETVAIAAAAAAVLYGVYRYTTRNDLTPAQIEQSLGRAEASAGTIKTGSVTVKTAESSALDVGKGVLRTQNPDGGITTYKYSPTDLNPYQRYLVENNLFTINKGVVQPKTFARPSLLGALFPPLGAYQTLKGLFA